jgi:hypothetical protein
MPKDWLLFAVQLKDQDNMWNIITFSYVLHSLNPSVTYYPPYQSHILVLNQEFVDEEHIQSKQLIHLTTFFLNTKLLWSICLALCPKKICLALWLYITMAKFCSRLYKENFAPHLKYWFLTTLAKFNSSCLFMYANILVRCFFLQNAKTDSVILWLLYVGNGEGKWRSLRHGQERLAFRCFFMV